MRGSGLLHMLLGVPVVWEGQQHFLQYALHGALAEASLGHCQAVRWLGEIAALPEGQFSKSPV